MKKKSRVSSPEKPDEMFNLDRAIENTKADIIRHEEAVRNLRIKLVNQLTEFRCKWSGWLGDAND